MTSIDVLPRLATLFEASVSRHVPLKCIRPSFIFDHILSSSLERALICCSGINLARHMDVFSRAISFSNIIKFSVNAAALSGFDFDYSFWELWSHKKLSIGSPHNI